MHLVRASLRDVRATDGKAFVAALKRIYRSVSADEAQSEREVLEQGWGRKYRAVIRFWRDNWTNIIQFFQFSTKDSQSDLHDERDRIIEHVLTKSDAQPAYLSERRSGDQSDVSGVPAGVAQLEADSPLILLKATLNYPAV